MKKRKTWYWVIGLTLAVLLICGGLVGFVLWLANGYSSDSLASGDAVAIVRVEGIILAGQGAPSNPFSSSSGAYSGQIIDYLEQANENEDVKAVILYVDSPGGSAFASDEIALQIQQMDKPIMAVMGSLAVPPSLPTVSAWA